jgi:putative Holliday junction resolvase
MEPSSHTTYIGLDVGERRIGVARVHSAVKIAEPLDHIDTQSQDVFATISHVIQEYQAEGVVVGLPRGLDGQETEQTQYCRDFADKLAKHASVPVYLIDEAGTSKLADDRMTKNSNQSRDSVAASILLEDFVLYTQKETLKV